MKTKLNYVQGIPAKNPKYFYFRNTVTGERVKLVGRPGTREFEISYQAALRAHAPLRAMTAINQARGAGHGSLAWVLQEYKDRSKEWRNAADSTREIYDRRHHWLIARFGQFMIWDFTREEVRGIRDLPEFADKPSVADATVDRLAVLWDFAEEFCQIPEMIKLNGVNPARRIKKLSDEESESAPVWPLELCKLFERCASPDLRKFYFLARYGGQRRSDVGVCEWEHFDFENKMVFVSQIKTGNRIWVPLPQRLIDKMATWPHDGKYVVMSPKKKGEPWAATSITNEMIQTTKDLGFQTVDSKGKPRFYSPHGLRHLCGVELAYAGGSDAQIASILGHTTMKQVQTYRKQANQLMLARGGQSLRDDMYRQQEHDEAIRLASNVTRLRA